MTQKKMFLGLKIKSGFYIFLNLQSNFNFIVKLIEFYAGQNHC